MKPILLICAQSLWLIFVLASCGDPETNTIDGAEVLTQNYKNGQTRAEAHYINGKKSGLSRAFYPNGRVHSEISYVNNMKEGVARNYYQTGPMSSESVYRNNERHGTMTKYHENGKVYYQCNYQNGKLHGKRTVFSNAGHKKSEMQYDNGVPLAGAKRFRPNGTEKPPVAIQFRLQDQSKLTGQAQLHIALSEDFKEVQYFRGVITSEGTLSDQYGRLYTINNSPVTVMTYSVMEGGMVMDKVEIVAQATDVDQQVYLVAGTYNLVLD